MNWTSIFETFIADGAVALFFGFFLVWLLDWSKRPRHLEFFFLETGTDKLFIRKEPNGELKYSFELVIRHPSGNTLQNGIYWQFFVTKKINPEVEALGVDTLPRQKDEGGVIKFYGNISHPIFSETTQELHYRFKGTFSLVEKIASTTKIPLFYFFSTEFGNFPKSLKYIDKNKGIVDARTMGKLYLLASTGKS